MGKRIYYVYALLDPRKSGKFKYTVIIGRRRVQVIFPNEPFYIGKGHSTRLENHESEAKRKPKFVQGEHKLNLIRTLHREGLAPIVRQITDLSSENVALKKEAALVGAIGRKDLEQGPLTNRTAGGDGRTEMSDADKKVLSDKTTQYWTDLSSKERKRRAKLLSDFYKNRSEEDKQKTSVKKSKANKEWHANLSVADQKVLSEIRKQMHVDMDEVTQRKRNKKLSERALIREANISPADKQARTEKAVRNWLKTVATRTSEKKKEISNAISDGGKLAWSRLSKTDRMQRSKSLIDAFARQTPKKKAATAAKQSATKLAMPVRECEHCGREGKGSAFTRWHGDNCRFK